MNNSLEKEFYSFQKKLGTKIQELRKAKGITQEEMASRIGIDRVAVGYIEQGVRSPRLRTLFLLSKELGKDIYKIMN